jgi:hypothetical protein
VIAADTSTSVMFLKGGADADVQVLLRAVADRQVVILRAVLTELLSGPKLPAAIAKNLSEVRLADISSGHWQRARALRSKVLAKNPGVTRRSTDAVSAGAFCF